MNKVSVTEVAAVKVNPKGNLKGVVGVVAQKWATKQIFIVTSIREVGIIYYQNVFV